MQKHHFEAVSLLTAGKGALKIAIIPAIGQPDWIVPFSLILDVQEYHEHTHCFLWHHQEHSQKLPVYSLLTDGGLSQTMVVLEGVTDKHRLALQTTGQIETMRVRIMEVKDVKLSQEELANVKNSTPAMLLQEGREHFVYQAVMIGQETYIIPDLDAITAALMT